ncbi:hypothetical protein VP91_00002820 [Candidatus Pelagibacter ubique]|uniref:Glycosyltransferase RgtA/B/C/D-like domain-containing protein n=1 Tax=Pelagibacter ubique TaxID=198252 RepID=A0ABX1T1Q1_PELUQ|nr:hypothetical protein [Candidatus Pelagibacter ubique]NMN67145.1 hypothetical protein [Candidatus Pelagibacter ubique]
MIKKLNNKNLIIYFSFFFILVGVFLRFYNLNYENLWFDEIVSYWIADPKISFFESYQRNNIGEGTPFLFNFLIKILHIIFGYSPNVGRYLSCTVSALSIISIVFLMKTIKNNSSTLLIIFLVSFNIFLIKYSQELRVYSLVLFLSSMLLLFYFRMQKENIDEKYISINSLYFIVFQILSILAHPFTIIIFGSIILYAIVIFFLKKKLNKLLNTSIIIISIFIIFYLPFYLINTEPYPSWISQPSLKFYTNFYFSKFFGSRILGIVHFIILCFLIFKFRKKFLKDLEPSIILIFLIFFSYFIPIIFGYLYEPILAPRYIIFILIPILILISYLTFELKEKKIRYFIIFLIIILTLGNLWSETTIKQFLEARPNHKPQYSIALKNINESKYNKLAINMSFAEKKDVHFNIAINNYFKQIITKEKLDIKLIKINNDENYFWLLCLTDLNRSLCNTFDKSRFKVLDEKNYNSINLKLIKFLN